MLIRVFAGTFPRRRPSDTPDSVGHSSTRGVLDEGSLLLGRSRGGLTTKVHLAADGRCRPLALVLTAGQAGDTPAFIEVMAAVRVPRLGAGRPRVRLAAVLADRAFPLAPSAPTCAAAASAQSSPSPPTQQANRRVLPAGALETRPGPRGPGALTAPLASSRSVT